MALAAKMVARAALVFGAIVAGGCNRDGTPATQPSVLSSLVWRTAVSGGEMHVYELVIDSVGQMTYGRRSATATDEDFERLAEAATARPLLDALADGKPCPAVALAAPTTVTLEVTPAGASAVSKAVTGCVLDEEGRRSADPPFMDIMNSLDGLLTKYFP